MNRSVVGWLIGAVAFLLLAVVTVGMLGGGIDDAVVARAQAAMSKLTSSKNSLADAQRQVADWTERYPDLFRQLELDAQWEQQIARAKEQLAEAEEQVPQLKQLIETNDVEQASAVKTLTEKISFASLSTNQTAAAILTEGRPIVEFKSTSQERLANMRQNLDAIQGFDDSVIRSQINQAVIDWPEKKSDLEERLAALEALQTNANQIWEATADARDRVEQGDFEPSDIPMLIQASERLAESKQALQQAPENLSSLIDQLYWAWDKVLVDLEIQEGTTVSFRKTLQKTKVRVTPGQDESDGTNASTSEAASTSTATDPAKTETLPENVVSIPKQEYESLKDRLGMVVEHKPAGKYDSEAEATIQPAGYAYIAPPSQQRNRYGYWSNRNGSSFWTFYGQYRFFGDLMGRRTYGPVTTTMYDDYRSRRRVGQPYYGTTGRGTKLYGSEGVVTRNKYASSKYVSTGGFRNSQYVRSGGKYRGSRYTTKSSSSSRSYRSRSSGSRSRSFGGK